MEFNALKKTVFALEGNKLCKGGDPFDFIVFNYSLIKLEMNNDTCKVFKKLKSICHIKLLSLLKNTSM